MLIVATGMSTIYAFRRKGYTPQAINTFCEKIGVTRAPNMIPITLLEHCCRLDLDPKVHRAMVVLRPLRVVLTNLTETEEITVPNHPYEDKGTHKVPLTSVVHPPLIILISIVYYSCLIFVQVYIERSDFRVQDEKGYYGLAPGKQAMLKYAHNITCTDVVYDENKEVVEIKATVNREKSKVKGKKERKKRREKIINKIDN